MTEQTAITPYQKLKSLVTSEEIQERFRQILGDKAPGFLASVINTVYLSDHLRDADPNSVLTSAVKAAVLDLPIDPNLGFAWIIPYRNNRRGIYEAQFQMGYKGYIQLALRSSQYQAINAALIYQGEDVNEDRLTGDIKLTGKKISDEVKGFVAYFRLTNGFEKYWYMSVDDMHRHAKRYSKSYGREDSPWATHFEQMGKKTVLKLLISKYGIMSITMMQAFKEDSNDDLSIRLTADPENGEVIDTVFEDDLPPQPENGNEPPTPPPAADDVVLEKLVADGKIDNVFHAREIIKKREPDCPLNEYDFVIAYVGWRGMGANSKKAAEYANAGDIPK